MVSASEHTKTNTALHTLRSRGVGQPNRLGVAASASTRHEETRRKTPKEADQQTNNNSGIEICRFIAELMVAWLRLFVDILLAVALGVTVVLRNNSPAISTVAHDGRSLCELEAAASTVLQATWRGVVARGGVSTLRRLAMQVRERATLYRL